MLQLIVEKPSKVNVKSDLFNKEDNEKRKIIMFKKIQTNENLIWSEFYSIPAFLRRKVNLTEKEYIKRRNDGESEDSIIKKLKKSVFSSNIPYKILL